MNSLLCFALDLFIFIYTSIFQHCYFCKLGRDFCLLYFLWYLKNPEWHVVWHVGGTH